MHHPEHQPHHAKADTQGPHHNAPNLTGKVLEEARGYHSDLTTILEDLQLAELIYQSELKHLEKLDEALQINPHLNPEKIRKEIAGICRNLMTTGYRPPKRTSEALEIARTKTSLETATTQIRGNTASDYRQTEKRNNPSAPVTYSILQHKIHHKTKANKVDELKRSRMDQERTTALSISGKQRTTWSSVVARNCEGSENSGCTPVIRVERQVHSQQTQRQGDVRLVPIQPRIANRTPVDREQSSQEKSKLLGIKGAGKGNWARSFADVVKSPYQVLPANLSHLTHPIIKMVTNTTGMEKTQPPKEGNGSEPTAHSSLLISTTEEENCIDRNSKNKEGGPSISGLATGKEEGQSDAYSNKQMDKAAGKQPTSPPRRPAKSTGSNTAATNTSGSEKSESPPSSELEDSHDTGDHIEDEDSSLAEGTAIYNSDTDCTTPFSDEEDQLDSQVGRREDHGIARYTIEHEKNYSSLVRTATAVEDRQWDNDLTKQMDNAGGKFSTRLPRKSAKLCERKSLYGRTLAPLSQERVENTLPRGSPSDTEVPLEEDQAKNHSVIDLTNMLSDGEGHSRKHFETNLEDWMLKDSTIINTQCEGMEVSDGTLHNHSFRNNDTHTSTTSIRKDSATKTPDASTGTTNKCLISRSKLKLPNSSSTSAFASSINEDDGEQLLNKECSPSTLGEDISYRRSSSKMKTLSKHSIRREIKSPSSTEEDGESDGPLPKIKWIPTAKYIEMVERHRREHDRMMLSQTPSSNKDHHTDETTTLQLSKHGKLIRHEYESKDHNKIIVYHEPNVHRTTKDLELEDVADKLQSVHRDHCNSKDLKKKRKAWEITPPPTGGYSIPTAPPIEYLQSIIQMRALRTIAGEFVWSTLWRDYDYASKEYSTDLRKRIEEVNKKSDEHVRQQLAPQFTKKQWNQIYRSVEKRFQKHTMEVNWINGKPDRNGEYFLRTRSTNEVMPMPSQLPDLVKLTRKHEQLQEDLREKANQAPRPKLIHHTKILTLADLLEKQGPDLIKQINKFTPNACQMPLMDDVEPDHQQLEDNPDNLGGIDDIIPPEGGDSLQQVRIDVDNDGHVIQCNNATTMTTDESYTQDGENRRKMLRNIVCTLVREIRRGKQQWLIDNCNYSKTQARNAQRSDKSHKQRVRERNLSNRTKKQARWKQTTYRVLDAPPGVGEYRAEDNTITPKEIPIATQWILDMAAQLATIFGDNPVVCYIGDCFQSINDQEKRSDKDDTSMTVGLLYTAVTEDWKNHPTLAVKILSNEYTYLPNFPLDLVPFSSALSIATYHKTIVRMVMNEIESLDKDMLPLAANAIFPDQLHHTSFTTLSNVQDLTGTSPDRRQISDRQGVIMATDITNSSNRKDDRNECLHTFYRYDLSMQDITLNVLQYNIWDDTWRSPTITIKTINGNIRFQLLKTDIVIRNLHEYICHEYGYDPNKKAWFITPSRHIGWKSFKQSPIPNDYLAPRLEYRHMEELGIPTEEETLSMETQTLQVIVRGVRGLTFSMALYPQNTVSTLHYAICMEWGYDPTKKWHALYGTTPITAGMNSRTLQEIGIRSGGTISFTYIGLPAGMQSASDFVEEEVIWPERPHTEERNIENTVDTIRTQCHSLQENTILVYWIQVGVFQKSDTSTYNAVIDTLIDGGYPINAELAYAIFDIDRSAREYDIHIQHVGKGQEEVLIHLRLEEPIRLGLLQAPGVLPPVVYMRIRKPGQREPRHIRAQASTVRTNPCLEVASLTGCQPDGLMNDLIMHAYFHLQSLLSECDFSQIVIQLKIGRDVKFVKKKKEVGPLSGVLVILYSSEDQDEVFGKVEHIRTILGKDASRWKHGPYGYDYHYGLHKAYHRISYDRTMATLLNCSTALDHIPAAVRWVMEKHTISIASIHIRIDTTESDVHNRRLIIQRNIVFGFHGDSISESLRGDIQFSLKRITQNFNIELQLPNTTAPSPRVEEVSPTTDKRSTGNAWQVAGGKRGRPIIPIDSPSSTTIMPQNVTALIDARIAKSTASITAEMNAIKRTTTEINQRLNKQEENQQTVNEMFARIMQRLPPQREEEGDMDS